MDGVASLGLVARYALPDDAEYVRTTPVFDARSVPSGLLNAHRLAPNTWAVVAVETGQLDFVFEDRADDMYAIAAGERFVVPPLEAHRVALGESSRFCIEFYRTR